MKTTLFPAVVSEPEPAYSAPAGARAAAAAPGLVNYSTSDTAQPHTVEIDQRAARMNRMRRSVVTSARMIEFGTQAQRLKPAMVTLTYRDVDGWAARHISDLMKHIRQWLERRGHKFRYVWVAELQKRGALHYHVLLWLPRGLTLPKPDKQGWWPHGHTRIEWARNAVGYLVKYVSKFDAEEQMPKGARLHGAGGLDAFGRAVRTWGNLPAWLRAFAGVGQRFVRIERGGLAETRTGVFMQSPWRVSFHAGRVVATRLFAHVGGIADVGGPYSLLGEFEGPAC